MNYSLLAQTDQTLQIHNQLSIHIEPSIFKLNPNNNNATHRREAEDYREEELKVRVGNLVSVSVITNLFTALRVAGEGKSSEEHPNAKTKVSLGFLHPHHQS
ncbi:unnamed protein product [Lathyrus oleraceus]